jgi:hypothetical protein
VPLRDESAVVRRSDELAALERLPQLAIEGTGSVAALVGEAEIGKTETAGGFAEQARQKERLRCGRVLQGRVGAGLRTWAQRMQRVRRSRRPVWHQSVPGLVGDGAEAGDQFGKALSPKR